MTLDIRTFDDYRNYLKAVCEARKQAHRHFSLAQWARKLSLKSSSTLIMILKGERNPSAKLVEKLIQDLNLDLEQSKYFRNLVNLEKASTNPYLRDLLLDQLPVMDRPNLKLIQMKYFRMMSQWYFLAIRELVNLPGFQEEPKWIQKHLRFHVSKTDIAEALEVLVQSELLARNADGKLVYPSSATTTFDVPDEGIKKFHQNALEVCKDAVEKVPLQEREMLNVTFTCKKEKLASIKNRIRKLINDLGEVADGEADTVYMMQIACIPLTQEEEEKDGKKK